jgi:pantoate--beta-alanine ligase
MQIVHSISELRAYVKAEKLAGKRIGFVPTMGNLHAGHLSLITEAKQHADIVICSIFVNPMQFGANEDLDAYPRTLAADTAALESQGCDLLFAPNANEVYPKGLTIQTRVEVPELGDYHCGASRPGHFVGVATVVAKLFNMVQPDVAIFGEKDYQQLAIIRKMTEDLCFPITLVGVATSRESSGLARSSRNGYLTEIEKQTAAEIHRTLQALKHQLLTGNNDLEQLCSDARGQLSAVGFRPDYINIANAHTLAPATSEDNELVILIAAYLGNTRLIDNITVKR